MYSDQHIIQVSFYLYHFSVCGIPQLLTENKQPLIHINYK